MVKIYRIKGEHQFIVIYTGELLRVETQAAAEVKCGQGMKAGRWKLRTSSNHYGQGESLRLFR